jgi:hypothetical protein
MNPIFAIGSGLGGRPFEQRMVSGPVIFKMPARHWIDWNRYFSNIPQVFRQSALVSGSIKANRLYAA